MEAWEGFVWGWTQRTCGPRCAERGEGQTRALGSEQWSCRKVAGSEAGAAEGPGRRAQARGPGTCTRRG